MTEGERAILDAIPFDEERAHLKMIEDRLPKWIDAAEERIGGVRVGRNNSVQHYPLAALAEIVFKFYNQRHSRHPGQKNRWSNCSSVSRASPSRENQVLGLGCQVLGSDSQLFISVFNGREHTGKSRDRPSRLERRNLP